jgi:hypothetical protein
MQEGQDKAKIEARGGLAGKSSLLRVYICAYLSHMRYLRITLPCVWVINKPCVRRTGYMRLISWTHHRGSEQSSRLLNIKSEDIGQAPALKNNCPVTLDGGAPPLPQFFHIL